MVLTMRRLGISVPLEQSGLDQLPALAREAEGLGFTDAWSFETNGWDAFTPLAAVLANTERMRTGTAIIPVFTRPPVVIAMHAATLDSLGPGRFVLGLGSSTPTVVEKWMGLSFEAPLGRTREVAQACRALLDGGRVGGARIAQVPPRHIPIYLAALGQAMARLAAEVGEGVVWFLAGPRAIPELIAAHPRPMDTVARITTIPGPRPAGLEAARRFLCTYALVPYYARFLRRQGFGEEVEAISSAWAAGDRDRAAAMVSDRMVDELALVGDPDRIAEGVQTYWRSGLGCPLISIISLRREPAARAAERQELLGHLSRSLL